MWTVWDKCCHIQRPLSSIGLHQWVLAGWVIPQGRSKDNILHWAGAVQGYALWPLWCPSNLCMANGEGLGQTPLETIVLSIFTTPTPTLWSLSINHSPMECPGLSLLLLLLCLLHCSAWVGKHYTIWRTKDRPFDRTRVALQLFTSCGRHSQGSPILVYPEILMQKYCIIHQELLAVVQALQHFHPYLIISLCSNTIFA